MTQQTQKQILLIISGGIAAYKSLELIRLFKKSNINIRCILTNGGAQFVTPLSVSALSENPVYTDLFSLKDESEMGHIRLSREADAIIVAPASANLMAKMAQGRADDLASTCLLAANKQIFIAPAMNVEMWNNASTQNNISTLVQKNIRIIGPDAGDMACGETGDGRMSDPSIIFAHVQNYLMHQQSLAGKKILITAGPTIEPIDPVRFISNHSSGKQGYAIAQRLADAGADVTLISGPTNLRAPSNVKFIPVQTADDMHLACKQALSSAPHDVAICTAAVADYKMASPAPHKLKKNGTNDLTIILTQNPDILREISHSPHRPQLVVGFAAETENLIDNARKKLISKGCDWILANLVGTTDNPVFGSDQNSVKFIAHNDETDDWGTMSKQDIAIKLTTRIIDLFSIEKDHINVKRLGSSAPSGAKSK
jgi:phosphopantothenoylcysteine decarboxylase/phosphopantothenate--cysteine ligase